LRGWLYQEGLPLLCLEGWLYLEGKPLLCLKLALPGGTVFSALSGWLYQEGLLLP
jgi:hypothetical protein